MSKQRKNRINERGPGAAPPPPQAGAAARLIREARQRRSIAQSDLARRLGVGQGLISRWETGRTEPSFAAVLRVLGACGYDVWAALGLIDGDRGLGRAAELHLLPAETALGDATFRRMFREQDAERRSARERERARRGG